MSRPVDRRTLLAGGAGLLLGAGGGVAGRALAATPSPPGGTPAPAGAPRVPSPGEELMTEHGVLKRVLLAYRRMSDQLGAGTPPPSGVVIDAAQIVADYVEGFHEGLEEAYVFPRVAGHGAELAGVVTTLLTQHDRGRHLTATVLATAAGDLTRAPTQDTLRGALDGFVRMYEPHEAWEDTVVYPALRRASSERTLDDLAERFADLENRQFGDAALARILGRVTAVEQRLGLADLASFTPPAPA